MAVLSSKLTKYQILVDFVHPRKLFSGYDTEMIIMGIDPGTQVTGYGIIHYHPHQSQAIEFGCIRLPAKAPLPKKLLILFEAIESLITRYKPEAVAVENPFLNKNVRTLALLEKAKAMALLAAEKNGISSCEYSPKSVKKAVVGTGTATKEQMQAMIRYILGLLELPTPHDAADALGLAICHGHSVKLCLNISMGS